MKKYLAIAVALTALTAVGATPVFAKSVNTRGLIYNFVPATISPSSMHDPALTGGGSAGYNAQLPIATD